VGEALVLDTSKHQNRIHSFDSGAATVCVEPGLVLEQLNRFLKPHGLFFPVDVSTGNRATLGGMAGNNSCGARSIRYGNMVHNVRAIEAVLADGTRARFDESINLAEDSTRYRDLSQRLRGIGARESEEIARRFPKLLRRVGGYNIDMLTTRDGNLARLLVGSEGTLAFFTRLHLDCNGFRRTRCSASAISRASTRRWIPPGTSSSSIPRRSNWWIAP
jgi:FAD/FMN-containing dehydrogenase